MTHTKRFLVLIAFFGLFTPSLACAETPASSVIRNFYAELVATMKLGPQLGFVGRHKKLAPVVEASFNMPLMTRVAVGMNWDKASKQEQNELISAFSNFSIANYANRFASYDGEEFAVIGEKPSTDGMIVETTLKPKTGDAIRLNYLMRADKKGTYRIVDIFTNGTISELATRRSEFSSIARRDGILALIKALDRKAQVLGNPAAP